MDHPERRYAHNAMISNRSNWRMMLVVIMSLLFFLHHLFILDVSALYVQEPRFIKGSMPFSVASFGLPYVTQKCDSSVVVVSEPLHACSMSADRIRQKAYSNKIVLVQRGVCTFVQKALAVQEAGAVGMIVWNTMDDVQSLLNSQQLQLSVSKAIEKARHDAATTTSQVEASEGKQAVSSINDRVDMIVKDQRDTDQQEAVRLEKDSSKLETAQTSATKATISVGADGTTQIRLVGEGVNEILDSSQVQKLLASMSQQQMQSSLSSEAKDQTSSPPPNAPPQHQLFTMSDDGNGKHVRIRSVMINNKDGTKIKKALDAGHSVKISLGYCNILKYEY